MSEIQHALDTIFSADSAVYQQRGDLEIWRIHPYECTLTTWRRLPDGSYEEAVHSEGVVIPTALPGVVIDLAMLFNN